MKKAALLSGILAGLVMPCPADANPTGDPVRAEPAPAATAIAPSCELHIYPTKEIFDDSYDKSSGVFIANGVLVSTLVYTVSAAIIDAHNAHLAKDGTRAAALAQLPTYLAPDEQIKALKRANILATLKLPADTGIIQEAVLPAPFGSTPADPDQASLYKQYWAALKKGTPVAATRPAAANACYRELIVSSITIRKSGSSFKFLSAFVYRTFDQNLSENGLYDGESAVLKPDAFPAQTEGRMAEASASIQTAFSDNFAAWVARRVKFK